MLEVWSQELACFNRAAANKQTFCFLFSLTL
uniref:Uncharacterized protein n=1 Tax=Anguilla anguilla TaxID=7936 RepID=A0A0E9P713_ANGAN